VNVDTEGRRRLDGEAAWWSEWSGGASRGREKELQVAASRGGRPGERRGGAARTPDVGCGSPGVNSWIGLDGPVVLLPNNDKV
jgi:hypothetical protein